jgi:putative transcriptional regulator
MSNENTIVTKRQSDGTFVQVLPDGTTRPLEDKTDWARLREMTDEEVHAAAMNDPDARPMTDAEWQAARKVPRAKTLRRALGLTQEEFAARFQIPIGTLRDWEQGRAEPDQPARAYLRVIAADAQAVQRALERTPPQPR